MQVIFTMNHLYKNNVKGGGSAMGAPYFLWEPPTISQWSTCLIAHKMTSTGKWQ